MCSLFICLLLHLIKGEELNEERYIECVAKCLAHSRHLIQLILFLFLFHKQENQDTEAQGDPHPIECRC